MDSNRNQPVLLLERNDERFRQVKQAGEYRDRTAVFGDLDSDGDTDVIVAQRSGDVRVLRNDSQHEKPLVVEMQGVCKGARCTITYTDGSNATRWNTDGFGFQSSSVSNQILLSKPVATIEVTWSQAKKKMFFDIPKSGTFTIN